MNMRQEAVISSDEGLDVKLRTTALGGVQIVQGNDTITIHADDFPSFLALARKWWDTSEIPDPIDNPPTL